MARRVEPMVRMLWTTTGDDNGGRRGKNWDQPEGFEDAMVTSVWSKVLRYDRVKLNCNH